MSRFRPVWWGWCEFLPPNSGFGKGAKDIYVLGTYDLAGNITAADEGVFFDEDAEGLLECVDGVDGHGVDFDYDILGA